MRMLNKCFLFPGLVAAIVLVFAGGVAFGQQKIPLAPGAPNGPVLTLERSDIQSTALDLSIDTLEKTTITTPEGPFSLLTIGDYGTLGAVGAPRLPAIREFVEVPFGASVTLRVTGAVYREFQLDNLGIPGRIVPVQPPSPKSAPRDSVFVIDRNLYGTNGWVRETGARLGEEVILRGRRLKVLEVDPVSYNPVTGTIKVLSKARIELLFSGADLEETRTRIEKVAAADFDRVVRAVVINGAAFETSLFGSGGAPARGTGYLMIADPSFTGNASLQALINLRTSEGFDVNLVDTNTTGSSTTAIKNYIQNQYTANGIEYVLLIGDTNTIPNWVGSGSYNPATDLNYACVDGSDFIPDILRGRFPVRTAADLTHLCDKIVAMSNMSIKKAVFMASEDNYYVSEGTHNYVISNYLDPDGWTSDKLYSHTYNATTYQVKTAFNDGRTLGTYSGHGSVYSWADGPPFSQSDVRSLTNTVYPFIQSYACLTGQYTATECFGETWVRDDHGATSFIGASVSSYWDEDDILEKRVYKGWFNQGLDRIGGMIDYGQYQLYLWMTSSSSFKRMYYEMYNLMGDPAMKALASGGGGDPVPDIKIDGQDGPLTVPSTQVITMTISLSPGGQQGVAKDWWVFGNLNWAYDFWWRYPGTWTYSSSPLRAYGGPLIALNNYVIAQAKIPAGWWTFTFAVDDFDNIYQGTYKDTIDVQSY